MSTASRSRPGRERARRAPAPLTLPTAVRRAIVGHARRARPRECCGLLLGRGRTIRYAVPVENVASGTTRYRLDPRAHIEIRRLLRGLVPSLDIVGVYHSHPRGSAVPSQTDVREAAYAGWHHVIVGLGRTRPRVAAWRIRSGRSEAVPIATS